MNYQIIIATLFLVGLSFFMGWVARANKKTANHKGIGGVLTRATQDEANVGTETNIGANAIKESMSRFAAESLANYDLNSPAQTLHPVLTPLRNVILPPKPDPTILSPAKYKRGYKQYCALVMFYYGPDYDADGKKLRKRKPAWPAYDKQKRASWLDITRVKVERESHWKPIFRN